MNEAQPKPPNFLEIHAGTQSDKLAIIGLERTLTYGQLRERSRALAKQLYGMGIRPGDHIAIMTYNLPEYAEINNSLTYLMAGPVMVGYRMMGPEIEYIVENSDAKMLFFYHEFADRILPHRERYKNIIPDGFVSFGGEPQEGALFLEDLMQNPPEVDLEAIPPPEAVGSLMIYTSGTTGKPKGAARRSDFATKPGVMEYLFTTIDFLKFTKDEIHLVCCPLYHSAPTYFALVTFILGGTLIYQPRFEAMQFLELIDRHRATSTHVVPTILDRLLQLPDDVYAKYDLSSMRTFICGAAPLFPEKKFAVIDKFGHVLYEYYGSTETGVNTFISPQEMHERPSSVGRAFADNELKILDENGKEVPDGERGVLYMYNALMMDGYYKNERATREVHQGKYLTVGDVAIRDSDGYIYIVDRVKDMIIRGGVNIYPAEVEEVLLTMPGIDDAAVVGKPDPEWGEIVAAFIVPEDGARAKTEKIQEYCRERMANNKIPEIIIFIDEIPRTPTGKVLKKELRERLKSLSAD
jgi:acyl-CoA synthetase (AMP-forming)/AMP-acid ligase II